MDLETKNLILNVVTPLVFVAVGVYANRLGRKDGDETPKINYFAVGTSVFIMSLATILADIHFNEQGYVEGNFGWVAVYLLCIFVSIDVDRYSSWVRCDQGLPTEKKHLWRGVVFPNSLGIIAFCLYRFMA